ncbi:MAG TPA: alpha/beta hydrolase [Gallionella sp.]|jgi:carboxylesterase|nr:alpha/beta hydrolase [Gallionella sp.]OGS68842.1 MAG: alpha/beta hydrolase [Gallionellales bacterium GWA2_54_124]OGT17580.1 MAG: alpha/beta hydrolase [Gallionellales bacterium RIFOXYD12_FULL_53_10]HCI53484.1 alpha/beta hydrolase [Gallionella sp.]
MDTVKLVGGEHAVLLVHGLQGGPTEMLPLAKRLNQAGYSVYVPHFAGYGYHDGDTSHSVTRWQDWHKRVADEVAILKQTHSSVSLGGLCIGAVLALSVAADSGSDIAALSLLSTTLYYDGWSIPWYRFVLPIGYYTPFRYFYSYSGRPPFGIKNEQLRKWVIREMNHKESSIAAVSNLCLPAIHEAELLIKAVKARLPAIQTPTLVIHATEDDVCSPRSAEYVMQHIGSTKRECVMLGNSYHMITVDNDREQVATETIRFFKSVRHE